MDQAAGLLGDDDAGRPQKTLAQFVAFAELLDDLALGDIRRFLLGNGLVEIGVEGLADGVDLLQAGFREGVLELLLNHVDARLERLDACPGAA